MYPELLYTIIIYNARFSYILYKYISQKDVDALIRLCLDGEVLHGKVKDSLKKLTPVGSNSCSPPQFVYLGQPSNKG